MEFLGRWLIVEHPALDTPEARGLGHFGYYDVAQDRQAVLHGFTAATVKAAVQRRGVRLISYRDLSDASKGEGNPPAAPPKPKEK
jgi:hypothetical protein